MQPTHAHGVVRRGRSRLALSIVLSACLVGLTAAPLTASTNQDASLEVSDDYMSPADTGFHDYTRTGDDRAIRNDLRGDLGGMVEFA